MDPELRDMIQRLIKYFGDEWPTLHVYTGGEPVWGVADEELASILQELHDYEQSHKQNW